LNSTFLLKTSPWSIVEEAPKESKKGPQLDNESIKLMLFELENQLERKTSEFHNNTEKYKVTLRDKEQELQNALGGLKDLMGKNQEESRKSRHMMGEDLQKLNIEQLEELLANLNTASFKVKMAITKVRLFIFSLFLSLL